MKKKLLLISPKRSMIMYDDFSDHVQSLTGKSQGLLIASLATIAALTPPEFEVKIIDENIEPISFDEPFDLVGMTSFPSQLQRAEEIAVEFSKRGVPVVCGGSSVSLSPERWRPFADVLIIGEAERTWPRFLCDYLAGSFQPEYREIERLDLSITPVPDYTGYSKRIPGRYMVGIVQTSRGCPYDCEFCDAIVYMGRKIRYKPIGNILREIEQLHVMGFRYILLADDNFSAAPKKAKKILSALRDWNSRQRKPISFLTQLSIEIAGDEEFLELAAEAGLTRVFVGIETPNIDSLNECHKYPNVKRSLLEDVKKFHYHGIQVLSGCMVGFDHDDLSIFQTQLDFFMQSGIPVVRVAPLQALDGTPLKERMVREGRYIDWEEAARAVPGKTDELNILTLIPKQMTPQQLKQGCYWLLWQLYKPENFVQRFGMFFENYENSPKKDKLEIPKTYIGMKELGIIRRLYTYLLTRSTPVERRVFRRMFKYARRSSHPRRFGILLENFMEFKSMHQTLFILCPGIDQVSYPA